jgi:hypothetical protein
MFEGASSVPYAISSSTLPSRGGLQADEGSAVFRGKKQIPSRAEALVVMTTF